jgi:mono/diheme cytochrome c family protein
VKRFGRSGAAALVVALVLALGVAAAACTEDTTDEPVSPETTAASPAPQPTEGDGGDDDGVDAESLFAENCAGCHGAEGEGGGIGPGMAGVDDRDAAEQQIRQGGGGMPAFEGQLSDEEIEALADYSVELQ